MSKSKKENKTNNISELLSDPTKKTHAALRKLYLNYLVSKYACNKEFYFLSVLNCHSIYNKHRQIMLMNREQKYEKLLAALESVIEKEFGDDIEYLEKLDGVVTEETFKEFTPEVLESLKQTNADSFAQNNLVPQCAREYIIGQKLFYARNTQETYEEASDLYVYYLGKKYELQVQIAALNNDTALNEGLTQFIKLLLEKASAELILENLKEIMIQKFGESVTEALFGLESSLATQLLGRKSSLVK